MAEPLPLSPQLVSDNSPDPVLYIEEPEIQLDPATVFGLAASLLLIVSAIFIEGNIRNFFNLPSVFIVILGTFAVTAISFSRDELVAAWATIKTLMSRRMTPPQRMASYLIDLSILACKRGVLSLTNHDRELSKEPFLKSAIQLVADGFQPADIESFLQQDIETALERQRKSAAILRRASEIAPGMGLIGTLIGLVQMLSQLNEPSTIGPAMAIALITTFYGAVMGTVVFAPLAVKVERNAAEDALLKTLILAGATSLARQENPRRPEILLNTILPASSRIKYFD